MYKYFKSDSPINFKTINNIPHFLIRLTDLSFEAKALYAILVKYIDVNRSNNQHKTGQVVRQEHGMYKVVDGDNVYVESARSTIANFMGKAMITVRGYFKELVNHGLLLDIRVGQGNMNKLFLKYPVDAEYTYTDKRDKRKEMIESLELENEQQKSGEEATTSTPPTNSLNQTGIIQIKTIVSQLTDECLVDKQCKNLLNLARGDTDDEKLDDIQRAVEDCYGKTPKTSYIRMLFNTLQNRYHDKPKVKNITKEPNSNKSTRKNSFSHGMYSHDWDLEELERQADDYMIRSLLGEDKE